MGVVDERQRSGRVDDSQMLVNDRQTANRLNSKILGERQKRGRLNRERMRDFYTARQLVIPTTR